MKISRRSLIGASAAGLASSALGLSGLQPSFERARKKGAKNPKNIIFCVVDGMAIQTMSMANQYQQMVLGHPSYWASLLNQDYVTSGLEETSSLNSLVTDSAAASSSWGSGRHIWNGMLNIYPDGTELRTLVSLMHEQGVRCGLVTTTAITDATPAGFAISSISRGLEDEIAEKYLKSGVDVLLGGGTSHFAPEKRKDGKDMFAEFAKVGFAVSRSRDELLAKKGKKLLGLFSDGSIPYTVDRNNTPEIKRDVPTLAEMVTAALEALKDSPKGFLLQLEGGRVDHGGHANDLAALLYDQMAFEEALKVVVDFALKDGETLVIVTADHATGGPSLNGAGKEYIESTGGLKLLSGMKSSYGPLQADLGNTFTRGNVQDAVEARLGIKLSGEEAEAIVAAKKNDSPLKSAQFLAPLGMTLAAMLGNHTKVTWTSGNHTSDHVLVTALGPGSEQVAGVTKNVHFFDLMLATKGIKWSNPTMTFEDASRHYEKLQSEVNLEASSLGYGTL
ncbi:MAG: hypothetical protein BGO01_05965 [Armatimonadetes bacterium 55-13]|nr:MAG: hypothetical protein BGO01_05965 [Armatimonadetes bacterium 55-13]